MAADLVDERGEVLVEASSAAAIMRPRAFPSGIVMRDRDLVALSEREACEFPHGAPFLGLAVGLDRPGRYAAFLLKPIPTFWVWLLRGAAVGWI
jgi:hypothetical protein